MAPGSSLLTARLRMRIFAGLFIAAATVALLEGSLRIFDPIGFIYFPESDRYFRNMVPDAAFGYIHTPDYRDTLQGVDVSVNSHGLRGPEFQLEKPMGVRRVMILGDSVVFGWGAPQDGTFPRRLEELLKTNLGPVEVIAAGVGSWNTRTEYEYLRTTGVRYDPDVLLLLIVANDIQPKIVGRTEVSRGEFGGNAGRDTPGILQRAWQVAATRSFVLGYIQYFLAVERIRAQSAQYDETAPEWLDARIALEGIIELSRDRDIDMIAYLFTPADAVDESDVFSLYRRVLDAREVPVFAAPSVVFSHPEYRNSIADSHPNTLGHRALAEDMEPVLRTFLLQETSSTPALR